MAEGDDLDALNEELTELRAENERLQIEAADSQARIQELSEALGSARDELARTESSAAQLRSSHEKAVAEYRLAALAAEPELPPELVAGETVEQVQAAIAAARSMVQQVRERLAEEREDVPRIPPGSAVRREADVGGLTPQQKIAEGLRRKLS